MPRAKKRECRIDAVVESEEDRDRIYQAAVAAQQSARVFIGQAALRAASPEGMQIARLEHITQVQEGLTQELEALKLQLQGLGENLMMVVDTSAKSIAQHAETHRQLDSAMGNLERAMAERESLRRQLDTAVAANSETQDKLMAILRHLGIKMEGEE